MPNYRPCPTCLRPCATVDGRADGAIKCPTHGAFSTCESCRALLGKSEHLCTGRAKSVLSTAPSVPKRRRVGPRLKHCAYCGMKLRGRGAAPSQFCNEHTKIARGVTYRMKTYGHPFKQAFNATLNDMAVEFPAPAHYLEGESEHAA